MQILTSPCPPPTPITTTSASPLLHVPRTFWKQELTIAGQMLVYTTQTTQINALIVHMSKTQAAQFGP